MVSSDIGSHPSPLGRWCKAMPFSFGSALCFPCDILVPSNWRFKLLWQSIEVASILEGDFVMIFQCQLRVFVLENIDLHNIFDVEAIG